MSFNVPETKLFLNVVVGGFTSATGPVAQPDSAPTIKAIGKIFPNTLSPLSLIKNYFLHETTPLSHNFARNS